MAGEFFYVLAGPVIFDLDGVEHEVPEGAAVWVPPGVSHRISNLGQTTVRMLGGFAPSGPELLFLDMQRLHERTGGTPSEEDVRAVLAEYDVERVGPSRFAVS